MENSSSLSIEDMIVHCSYGIGKLDSVKTRSPNGVKVECYKVNNENREKTQSNPGSSPQDPINCSLIEWTTSSKVDTKSIAP
jgi:RNA polymerase-interacting CarD/CdnL/TRCF family regulator